MKKTNSRPTTIEDLPDEILLRIFMCLNIMQLVRGPSQVCRLWRLICRDPILWKRINLTKIGFLSNPTLANGRALMLEQGSHHIMTALKSALNLGGESVTTLDFNLYMLLRSDDLLCVAERSPNLRRLSLPVQHQLDEAGFEEAVKHWKDLESMTLLSNLYPCNMVRALGTYCKNFVEIKVMCPLDFDLANAFVMHIPRLKILSMFCTKISRKALVHLLKNMKHLEVLNLSYSFLINDYLIDEFGVLSDPSSIKNEIYPLASSLKTFVPWDRVEEKPYVQI